MECSHCMQLFFTTEFYDHMREQQQLNNRGNAASGIDMQSSNGHVGGEAGGRITEEFTLCYEDCGNRSYQSQEQSSSSLMSCQRQPQISASNHANADMIPMIPQTNHQVPFSNNISRVVDLSCSQILADTTTQNPNNHEISVQTLWHNYNHKQSRQTATNHHHIPNQSRSHNTSSNVGGYLMSKHQKIMSFDNSMVMEGEEDNHRQQQQMMYHTQMLVHNQEGAGEFSRILRSSQIDIDIGNEGNKSTYLRPSRNRDMSSLDLKANSRSCSNVLLKDTSRAESEERVMLQDNTIKVKNKVEMPRLNIQEALKLQEKENNTAKIK